MLENGITHAVTVLVVGLVLGSLARAARRAKPRSDLYTAAKLMRYPAVARILMWASCGVFGILTAGAFWARHLPNGPPPVAVILFLVMFSFCVLTALETSQVRVSWTDFELCASTPWSGDKRIAWTDVSTFTYSEVAAWLVVKSRSGETIRIPYLMGGIDVFLNDVESRLEPSLCAVALGGIRKRIARGR